MTLSPSSRVPLVALLLAAASPAAQASSLLTAPDEWGPALSRMVFGEKPPVRDRLVLRFQNRRPFCALTYPDGTAYRGFAIVGYHCDFLHAFVEKEEGADKYFNGASPDSPHLDLAGQLSFLRTTRDQADAYYANYRREAARAVALLDAKTPAAKVSEASLRELQARRQKALGIAYAAAVPFVWPPSESLSYLRPGNNLAYDRWQSYLTSAPGLAAAVQKNQAAIDAAENGLMDGVAATVRRDLKTVSGPRPTQSPTAALNELNRVFDGSRTAAAGPLETTLGPSAGKRVRFTAPARPRPSDLRAAPPPITIPDDAANRAARNYFARGAVAGALRLKDEARVQFWHATGASFTVGNPAWRAGFIVQQLNGTCAVGAQYEALRARGMKTTMPQLTRAAADHGWYFEYRTLLGDSAGTHLENSNALLALYRVRSRTIVNSATEAQLQQSIRTAGDAIITVRAREFWAQPSVPKDATHNVYVSGMEVGESGAVLGYYVNDTRSGEAARFVPAALLRRAWTKTLVQMLPNPSLPPPRATPARA